MKSFNNKVVWITGASSGIGEALACAFAAQGAQLILSSRRKEELERVKALSGLADQDCLILPLDLSDTLEMGHLTGQVIARFGKIDILVNNGGISQRSYAENTPLEIDRKIMEINYFAAVALTKSVLPFMIKNKSGHIVVMSSISGKFGFFLRSAYSASKHALHGFFESLRLEVNPYNISISLICPGKIKTAIAINAINEKGERNNRDDESSFTGMSASDCAKQILRAIQKKKVETFIGGKELKAIRIKRLFPDLFFKLILRQKIE
jgi:short-subunit dehydrogenase